MDKTALYLAGIELGLCPEATEQTILDIVSGELGNGKPHDLAAAAEVADLLLSGFRKAREEDETA